MSCAQKIFQINSVSMSQHPASWAQKCWSLGSEEIGVVFLGYRIRRGRGPGVTSLVHAWLNVRCVRIRRVNIAIKGIIDIF